LKKENLVAAAREIFQNLSQNFAVEFDDAGSIGKRYRRHDEIGTPFCATVDFETLENGTVTLRDRDSMTQKRIKIEDLTNEIQ